MWKKLVRDKIPKIIMYSSYISDKSVNFHQVKSNVEFREVLERKLQEEAAEFLLDPSSEELADLIEVIETLKEYYPDVEKIRLAKAENKGTFKEGWVMNKSKTKRESKLSEPTECYTDEEELTHFDSITGIEKEHKQAEIDQSNIASIERKMQELKKENYKLKTKLDLWYEKFVNLRQDLEEYTNTWDKDLEDHTNTWDKDKQRYIHNIIISLKNILNQHFIPKQKPTGLPNNED